MALGKYAWIIIILAFWAGCSGQNPDYFASGDLTSLMPKAADEKLNGEHIREGLEALEDGEYAEANQAFGKALKFDPDNSSLHFLNGLSYFFRGISGDSSQFEMAVIGYKQALQFNSGNFWAAYHMGQIHFKNRRFSDAQEAFAYALMFQPDQPDLLHALAASSYYARDLKTAVFAIDKAQQYRPKDPRILSTAVMIHAAVGQFNPAEKKFEAYKKLSQDPPFRKFHLKQRVNEWENYFTRTLLWTGDLSHPARKSGRHSENLLGNPSDNIPLVLPVQGSLADDILGGRHSILDQSEGDDQFSEEETDDEPRDEDSPEADGKGVIPQMALVDVTIIRSEERFSTSKGVNLLAGLKLNYSHSFIDKSFEFDDITNQKFSQDRTGARSLKAQDITYSLNIFNSEDDRNEVLARPTLIVLDGKTSEFFSGAVLNVQISGEEGSQGTVQSVPVGILMKLKVKFLNENLMTLTVRAARDFFQPVAPEAGNFQNFSQTSKTDVTANVTMSFGQTLVLSGLSEKVTEREKSGVPLLQDIPLIQYFFSKENTQEITKSVLILLTPRKPRYTYQDGSMKVAREQPESGTKDGPNLKELQKRFDWIKPAPNLDAVLFHLRNKNMMNQFRKGDVTLERWDDPDLILTSIKRNLQFLYY